MRNQSNFHVVDNQPGLEAYAGPASAPPAGLEVYRQPENQYQALEWEQKNVGSYGVEKRTSTVCGIRRGFFWALCIGAAVVIIGAAVGGGIGAWAHNKNKSHEASTPRYRILQKIMCQDIYLRLPSSQTSTNAANSLTTSSTTTGSSSTRAPTSFTSTTTSSTPITSFSTSRTGSATFATSTALPTSGAADVGQGCPTIDNSQYVSYSTHFTVHCSTNYIQNRPLVWIRFLPVFTPHLLPDYASLFLRRTL